MTHPATMTMGALPFCRLGPFAVAERLDDLAVADTHEVHAAKGGLCGVEPPTDDGSIAVHVDVLDFETDVRLTDEP